MLKPWISCRPVFRNSLFYFRSWSKKPFIIKINCMSGIARGSRTVLTHELSKTLGVQRESSDTAFIWNHSYSGVEVRQQFNVPLRGFAWENGKTQKSEREKRRGVTVTHICLSCVMCLWWFIYDRIKSLNAVLSRFFCPFMAAKAGCFVALKIGYSYCSPSAHHSSRPPDCFRRNNAPTLIYLSSELVLGLSFVAIILHFLQGKHGGIN